MLEDSRLVRWSVEGNSTGEYVVAVTVYDPENDPDVQARWTTANPDTFEDTTMTTETINKLIEIQQGVLTDTTKSAAERTAAVHEIERLKDTRDHPLVEPTLRERMVKLAQESVAIAKEAGAGADVEGAIFQRLLTGNR
jgi:chorismate mutase